MTERCIHVALLVLLALGELICTPAGAAVQIVYTVVDIPDEASGSDLWRYDYSVEGRAFLAGSAFEIFSDQVLFSDLQPDAVPAGWSAFVLLADPNEFFPEFAFAALADTDDLALRRSFSVRFAWHGAGTPGAQAFTVFDSDFNVTANGITTLTQAVVPEPDAVLLLLIGLSMALFAARRSRVRT
jgi:hypothetical protein